MPAIRNGISGPWRVESSDESGSDSEPIVIASPDPNDSESPARRSGSATLGPSPQPRSAKKTPEEHHADRALARLLHADGWTQVSIVQATGMARNSVWRAVNNMHMKLVMSATSKEYRNVGGRDDPSLDATVVDVERLAAMRKLGKPREVLETQLATRRVIKEKATGTTTSASTTASETVKETPVRSTRPQRTLYHPYKSIAAPIVNNPTTRNAQPGSSKHTVPREQPPHSAERKDLRVFLSKVKPGLSLTAYLPVFVLRGLDSAAKLQQLNEWAEEDIRDLLGKCFGQGTLDGGRGRIRGGQG
ncbi:hypothetical protein MKEN_00997300 [Mycena kentingensis (nom. inval.)]|nr:hypothetical protein MKEN_00997300 [Mycena kentingensis (nom. inval.)]